MKLSTMATMAALLLASGCQSDAYVRSQPPLTTFTASRNVDATVTCLIPSLGKNLSAAAIGNFRFVAQVIAPGTEYDIVPTDGFVNGHYTYTVNVKANGKTSTIALYKGQAMLPSLTEAIKTGIKACL
ncbi:hypothetical protein [Rhizobium sp. SGZ-381]|uniref:hypothetical protein n=1 Tax=Rhizobium sp. SGZ-381 TaxID=3342800 RepID=UPI0036714C32